jgi:hypothetical protein
MMTILEGKIKRVVSNEILGWCKHPQHNQPLKLGVWINDQLQLEVLSNEPRKSLSKKGYESTNHGFRIPIADEWPDSGPHPEGGARETPAWSVEK